jgi:hypothetical protein
VNYKRYRNEVVNKIESIDWEHWLRALIENIDWEHRLRVLRALIKWIHVLCNNFPLFLPYANRIYSIIPELLSRLAYQRIILILKTKQQNVLCNICMTPYQLFGFSLDPKSLSSNILSNSKHFFAHP